VLFVHAEKDPIVPYVTGRRADAKGPWPKALLTLPGAHHIPPHLQANLM
jgi:pimeloyl-ACP methyl ester carboxylesterase